MITSSLKYIHHFPQREQFLLETTLNLKNSFFFLYLKFCNHNIHHFLHYRLENLSNLNISSVERLFGTTKDIGCLNKFCPGLSITKIKRVAPMRDFCCKSFLVITSSKEVNDIWQNEILNATNSSQ